MLAGASAPLVRMAAASGDHDGHFDLATRVDPALLERPIGIETGIGKVHQPVTAATKEAQAFYDQGLAEVHSYRWIEAAQSFREALRLDPKLAMAEAGLARVRLQLHQPEDARQHVERARALDDGATPRERAWIEAQALQIDAALAAGEQKSARIADYRRALDALIVLDPSDPEAHVLRGLAEEPSGYGRGQGGGAETLPHYRAALERAPDHPGAHHYLAHSLENMGRYPEAAEHALAFANQVTAAAHAQHMAGHALGRLGRWSEATAKFEAADKIENDADRSGTVPHAQDWHHLHNLMLLGLSQAQEGRADDARRTLAKGFAAPNPSPTMEIWYAVYPEYLLSTGDADAALGAARELGARPSPILRAIGAALEGEALLSLGRDKEAQEAHARATKRLEELRGQVADEPMTGNVADVVDEFIVVLEERTALRANQTNDARVLEIAGAIASTPSFDGWARMHLRLPRLEADALAAKRPALAAQIELLRARANDPTAAPSPAAAAGAAAPVGPIGTIAPAGAPPAQQAAAAPAASAAVAAAAPPAAVAAPESWNDEAIQWLGYQAGVEEAARTKKPICLVFYTDWCPHCRNYSRVFHSPEVVALAKSFVMIRVERDQQRELSGRYAPDGDYIPRTLFLTSSGDLVPDIDASRPQFRYFYDEHDPSSVLASMHAAAARLGKPEPRVKQKPGA